MNKSDSLDKVIERLGRSDDFYAFMAYVHSQREASIGELAGANDSRVQQIAGEVVFADRLLSVAQYWQHRDRMIRNT